MESSLQDLIATFLPHMAVLVVVLIALTLVYDPTLTVFLYSMLPESYKTWLWFLACLMEEVRSMTIVAAIAVPAFQIQVMAFDLVNKILENDVCNTLKRYFLILY